LKTITGIGNRAPSPETLHNVISLSGKPDLKKRLYVRGPPFASFFILQKLYRIVLWVQGSYTALTALWAIIDIDSFMKVTGPKTDIWLVKTVSVTLVAIGICLLSFLKEVEIKLPAIILGLLAAIGLAVIDFYYSGNHVISWIYSLDGFAETIFSICWVIIFIKWQKN
jgi:hypothetical protein